MLTQKMHSKFQMFGLGLRVLGLGVCVWLMCVWRLGLACLEGATGRAGRPVEVQCGSSSVRKLTR